MYITHTLKGLNGDFMYDVIFTLNGKELTRYDWENSFPGEGKATRELLASENNVNVNDIKVYYQKRFSYDVKLYRNNLNLYGEYENLDYKNLLSILSECISLNNKASVKVNGKNFFIQNNEHLKLFVEEFGEKIIN